MSAALTMAAAAQATGELAALIDVADALDPRSAQAAGIILPRLLWVRPRSIGDGLKAADWLLDAGGFGLVILYAAGTRGPRIAEAAWIKLARRAERAASAVVVIGDRPLVGPVAVMSLQATLGRARWVGGERGGPRLLDGVHGKIAVARSKLGPPVAAAELPLDVARGAR
jgi:hypothetical protein